MQVISKSLTEQHSEMQLQEGRVGRGKDFCSDFSAFRCVGVFIIHVAKYSILHYSFCPGSHTLKLLYNVIIL